MLHREKSWQEIAAEMTAEKDLKQMIVLAKQLQEAIKRQYEPNLQPTPSPSD
jgi:hypothetical protein